MRMINVLRRTPRSVLACGFALALCACGGPSRGEPRATRNGRYEPSLNLLELTGTAAEMGRAQGRLLGGRIRALYRTWREALWQAALGVLPGDDSAASAALRSHIEDVVDAAAFRLPERVRQELDALAAEVGLEPLELLEVEVLRDALRMRGVEPRLRGALAVVRDAAGAVRVRARWTGPDAALLQSELVWVVRRPSDGRPPTLTLAWPGALGGLLVAQAPGAPPGPLVTAADVEVPAPWRGFGHGLPFSVALRVAVEAGSTLREVAGSLKGSVGHVALTVDMAGGDPVAVASTEAYLTPLKTVHVLDASTAPALFVGPFADLESEGQAALDAERGAAEDVGFAAAFRALELAPGSPSFEVALAQSAAPEALTFSLAFSAAQVPTAPAPASR